MPQSVRAEDGDVARSEPCGQTMNKGEGIGDEAATDMEVGDDLGDGVERAASLWDSGPRQGALLITANVGDEFVELEKCTVQAPKK